MSIHKFRWQDAGTWPFDGPSHVFLGRAFHLAGQSIYGEQWRSSDVVFTQAPRPPQLPEKFAASVSGTDRFKAAVALRRKRAGWPIPEDPTEIKFETDEWAEARQAVAEQYEGYAASAERNRAVRLLMRERFADETLAAFIRDGRGIFVRVGGHVWNTEKFDGWFDRCTMNANSPDSLEGREWLFVGKEGLQSFIAALATPAQAKPVHAGGREAYAKALREIVLASPSKRTHSKTSLAKLALDRFQLSGRQAEQTRLHVLAEIGGAAEKVWRAAGRG